MRSRQTPPAAINRLRQINLFVVLISITIGVVLFAQSEYGIEQSMAFDISPIDTPTYTPTATPPASPIDTPTPRPPDSVNSIYLPGIARLIDFRSFLPVLFVSR